MASPVWTPEPLTPFEYKKKLMNSANRNIGITACLVVGYMFITAIIGNFVSFGGIWWAIVFSYLVSISGAAAYCITKFATSEDLTKEYKEQYELHQEAKVK